MLRTTQSLFSLLIFMALLSCNPSGDTGGSTAESETTSKTTKRVTHAKGQASVEDDDSQKNIIQIAAASKDHSTLVAAIEAAEMSHVLANPGPLTVFAPTNAAFDKLPAGTVEDLVKPENKATLTNIIYYHATPGVYGPDQISGIVGMGQANAEKVEVTKKDGETFVNGNKVVASVRASNGWVHVIDGVLLPAEK